MPPLLLGVAAPTSSPLFFHSFACFPLLSYPSTPSAPYHLRLLLPFSSFRSLPPWRCPRSPFPSPLRRYSPTLPLPRYPPHPASYPRSSMPPSFLLPVFPLAFFHSSFSRLHPTNPPPPRRDEHEHGLARSRAAPSATSPPTSATSTPIPARRTCNSAGAACGFLWLFITCIGPATYFTFFQDASRSINRRLKLGWGKDSGPSPALALAVHAGALRNIYSGTVED
ncbi:hypothetical protein C8J57DRAFT_1707213 [Mycena rebaudengoi]|nr:hypothetical protein C8J57DRAFT_1707213 [Mycena rebaudengoi]